MIAKKYGLETTKLEPVLKKVKGARTHFSPTGIKTQAGIKEVVEGDEENFRQGLIFLGGYFGKVLRQKQKKK